MSLDQKYNLNLVLNEDFFAKEEHWLPRKMGVQYFAFGNVLYCDKKIDEIPAHEFLHIAQFHKYGIFRVIWHYLYHFVANYKKSMSAGEAFMLIPFEVEAREYERSKGIRADR